MYWFKILLLVIMGLSFIVNLHDVSKGVRMVKTRPIISAISSVASLLIGLGVYFWL